MQEIPEERRQYFRVQQEVIFDFKPIEPHTAEYKEPEQTVGDGSSVSLLGELRRIDRDLHILGKALTEKERLIGDYLHKLNSKIDLIAHHSAFASDVKKPPTEVSLSEGGITFSCDQVLDTGSFLVLQIIFLPNYTPVIVFAQVSRCDPAGNRFSIAARFHRLRDSDRQELAKQVLKAQINQRKRDQATEKKP